MPCSALVFVIGYDHEQVPYWRTVLGRCRQVVGQVVAGHPLMARTYRVAVPLTALLLVGGMRRQGPAIYLYAEVGRPALPACDARC